MDADYTTARNANYTAKTHQWIIWDTYAKSTVDAGFISQDAAETFLYSYRKNNPRLVVRCVEKDSPENN